MFWPPGMAETPPGHRGRDRMSVVARLTGRLPETHTRQRRALARYRTWKRRIRHSARIRLGENVSVSGRYFQSARPDVTAANRRCTRRSITGCARSGTGAAHQQAFSSWANHCAFLNLLGARYVVLTRPTLTWQSPQMKQMLASYGQTFHVAIEKRGFIAAFRQRWRASVCDGLRARAVSLTAIILNSAQLALALATRNFAACARGPARGDATGEVRESLPGGEAPVAPLA